LVVIGNRGAGVVRATSRDWGKGVEMMKMKFVASLALASTALIAQPAIAQEFKGTAQGCFTTTTCSPSGGSTFSGLTYTPGAFDLFTDSHGHIGVGGTSNNLGSFSLNATPQDYGGEFFDLLVTFTLPTGTSPNPTTLTATLTGQIVDSTSGGVTIDFNNNWLSFNSDAGPFLFSVNDVSVSPDSRIQILSGQIQALPEPATWGMMLLGFGGIGFAMRRRRQPALAQVA
jgi:hypothetical protein